jgi:pimeloyl-ACP methyl ester carboxylesterase
MDYIYLHGFLSGPDSQKGRYLEKSFGEAGHKLHRPDLNGSDFSQMTISSQLEIIDSLLQSISGEVVLLGSSLGGYLAALTAGKWKKVIKLIFMAPAFDFINRYFQRLTPSQLLEWQKTGFVRLYHYQYKGYRQLGYQIANDAQKYKDLSLDPGVPTLIFHGLRDESVPYQVSIEYLEHHPGTELILLHSDHGLYDQLDEMWGYIRFFLDLY